MWHKSIGFGELRAWPLPENKKKEWIAQFLIWKKNGHMSFPKTHEKHA